MVRILYIAGPRALYYVIFLVLPMLKIKRVFSIRKQNQRPALSCSNSASGQSQCIDSERNIINSTVSYRYIALLMEFTRRMIDVSQYCKMKSDKGRTVEPTVQN